jgi:hypothetical protein
MIRRGLLHVRPLLWKSFPLLRRTPWAHMKPVLNVAINGGTVGVHKLVVNGSEGGRLWRIAAASGGHPRVTHRCGIT